MGVFESKPGTWPIHGWESRSQIGAVLKQYGLHAKFESRVRTIRSRETNKGRHPPAREILQEAIEWIGAKEGPEKFKPTTAPDKSGPNKRPRLRLRDDIEWVYLAMGAPSGKEGLPPTQGAQALLAWARENPDDFFRNVWSKLLPKVEAERVEAEKFGEDGRPLVGLERDIADKLRALNAGVSQDGQGEPGVPPMAARLGPRVTREA
jgi:hypothetical protein